MLNLNIFNLFHGFSRHIQRILCTWGTCRMTGTKSSVARFEHMQFGQRQQQGRICWVETATTRFQHYLAQPHLQETYSNNQTQVREIFLSADLAEHRGWSIALVITSVSSFSKGSAKSRGFCWCHASDMEALASECQNNGSWFTNSLFIWVKVLLVGNCSGWATDWWFVRI